MKNWPWISRIVSSASLLLTIPMSADGVCAPYQEELDSAVYGGLDYLLWYSNQDGLRSPTVATGDSPNLSSKWSSGVRATIGRQYSCWDTELNYTYYCTSSKAQSNANIQAILNSTPSTAGIFEVGEKWNLHFNRIDLQLGRKILFGDSFLFEPFFGLESLVVTQKFNLNVNTVFVDLVTDDPATDVVYSKNRNSLFGIGPRAGFKALYDLKGGFGLYGNCGVNVLWGTFKIKQNYNQTDYYSSGGTTVLADQDKQISQDGSILNTDIEIGLSWRHLFPRPNMELEIKLGWEQHYYVNIVRFQDFYLQQTSSGTAAYMTNGNLCLSGFTLGLWLKY